MTDHKKMLRLQAENKRLHKANDALQHQVSLADEASQAKSDFLAMISHEYRTPLNGVIGITNLLLDTKLSEKQRKYTELIHSSAQDLLTLINSILDFSKLEADRLEVEEEVFNLEELIIEVMSLYTIEGARKGLDVHYELASDLDVNYLGDENRLRQVLANLIGNGIKFTDTGFVILKAEKEELNAHHLISFVVEDSGIGIPPEKRQYLFLPFSQLDTSSTRKYGGTGLGLAICKKLVALMGGEIDVDANPGTGSTFRFSVSLEPAPVSLGASQEVSGAVKYSDGAGKLSASLRVLIVEDDATNRLVLGGMLEHANVTHSFAHNGREAIDKWKDEDFDLVLMDCQMPVMSGYEATAAIIALQKESPSRKKPAIVALTADVTLNARQRCREAGMDAYLEKPIDIQMLRDVVSDVLPWVDSDLFLGRPLSGRMDKRDVLEKPSNDVELINMKTLERLEQNIGDIQPVLQVFLERLPKMVSMLKKGVEENNLKVVLETAHKLKGSCGQFGAVQLARLCAEVGEQGRNGTLHGMTELIGRISKTATETESFFQGMLD